jgi:serine/threonine protein kinase
MQREVDVLVKLIHPNTVSVLDRVLEGDELWIVMEYLQGKALSEMPRFEPKAASRLGAELAGGLDAVHAAGILHRDVKPANVMITDHGYAKLADFGISRDVSAAPTLTGTGAVTGTPGFIAPEVVRGGKFTRAADVFSLGATLFHAVEGVSPFGDW